ncbi:hypothetical protein BKA61DRAFT_318389 [Leptodontidium sp. MPI-SDFR-AT-0119]|nr:hypothetical protein BKA61DRAFT_318389 [Leptodontidium sp. MPI-SDFR-AT-0119]
MSFGWAAGDVALALRVLYKVGCALNETRGASAAYQESSAFLDSLQKTLEHLRIFASSSNASINSEKLNELEEQVSQIRVPVTRFVEDLKKFEPSLTADSSRSRLFVAPRKIQWSFQMESRLKKLQDSIMLPMLSLNLVFGFHMISLVSTMRTELPLQVQDDFSKVLHQHFPGLLTEGLQPWTTAAIQHKEEILERQALLSDKAMDNANENCQIVLKGVNSCRQEGLRAVGDIRATLETFSSRIDNLPLRIEEKMMSLRIADETAQATLAAAISTHSGELREIGQTIARIPRSRLDAVFSYQDEGFPREPEFRDLCRQFQICAWLLIASIQQLIRKLSEILVPHLIALGKAIRLPQQLLPFDDNFIFENALGRTHRLSTAQFQDWNLFYEFLKDSFKDLPGFSWVLSKKFRLLNQFNGAVIDEHSWLAAVQPQSRVVMAMLLDRPGMSASRCPSCRGQIRSFKAQKLNKCSRCSQSLIISSNGPHTPATWTRASRVGSDGLRDESQEEVDEFQTRLSIGDGKPQLKVESLDELVKDGLNEDRIDEDMRAFKLVTWQPEDFSDLTVLYQPMQRKPNIE